MLVKNIKIFIFYFIAALQTNFAFAKDYGTKPKPHVHEDPSKKIENFDDGGQKKIPPLPRHVLMPEVSYSRAPDVEGEYILDFSKHKFWIVAIIASWNQKSVDIAKAFNSNMTEFKNRDIGVIGLFSQNSEKEVEKWRLKNKPLFDNYFASRNFIDSLKNPQVPIMWLIGEKGEVLFKAQSPTSPQIDALLAKSFVLTDF